MNTDLGRKAKNDFEKDFLKLMKNAVFGKTIGHVRKHRDENLVTRERNQVTILKSFLQKTFRAIEMKKQKYL